MKRTLTLAVVVGLLSFVAFVPAAGASSTLVSSQGNNGSVSVAKAETKNGSYYAAAQTVTIDGTVNGDVYCAGQDIMINGTVNGDVLCAGQQVAISGMVTGDVRTAGQMVDISGTIGGTVSSFSQQTTIAEEAIVKGSLNGGSQRVVIKGVVEKDVVISAQELAINGQVKGDVTAEAEKLTLTNSPSILGNLAYAGSRESSVDKSKVSGTTSFTQRDDADKNARMGMHAFASFALMMLIACVASAVLLVLVAPRYYERSFALVNKKFAHVLAAGFTVLIAVPIVAIIMMMSVILLPLGIALLSAAVVVHILAFSFVAYYVGRWVFVNAIRHSVLVMFAGAIIVAILMMIPLVGFLTLVAVHVIGTGGLVMTAIDGYKRPRYALPIKK